MDETLRRLGSYTASKDSRLACAAAVIISELAPKDHALVAQLVTALDSADAVRRPFLIEALGRIGNAEAAAALVRLIKSEGPASEQALRAIAHTASSALKPLLGLLGSVQPNLLERIAECVGRTGEQAAFQGLIARLEGADIDICRAVRGGLRTAMTTFDEKAKDNLRKQLEKGFRQDELTRHAPALIALMKISGDLGDISLQPYILPRIVAAQPVHVRRAALQSLAMLHYSAEQRAKLAPKLLPLLQDTDQANIAEPALDALKQARMTGDHQSLLRKLLNSPSPRIREFAMQTLAATGSNRTLSELLECLASPDRSLREEALGALSRSPSAATVLAERLLEVEGEAALDIARALAPQALHLTPRMLGRLADEYVDASHPPRKGADSETVRRNEEKRRAILAVFRGTQSDVLVERVADHARKLQQKHEIQRAYEILKSAQGIYGWSDEHKLQLAFVGLQLGPKDLARSARIQDPNLRSLEDVVGSGRRSVKELARMALKDSPLDRKALYYLGFHFVERMQLERQFGQAVLENLADTRSDEGRQAREKLVIEGLLTVKRGQNNILEQRAKALMAASDMKAVVDRDSAKRAREYNNGSRKNGQRNAKKKPAGRAVRRTARASRPAGRKKR